MSKDHTSNGLYLCNKKPHQYLCKPFFFLTTSLQVIVPLIFYDIFIFCRHIELFLFQQRMGVISKCCCCMLKIYKRRKWYHQSYAETFLASKHLWETSIPRYIWILLHTHNNIIVPLFVYVMQAILRSNN